MKDGKFADITGTGHTVSPGGGLVASHRFAKLFVRQVVLRPLGDEAKVVQVLPPGVVDKVLSCLLPLLLVITVTGDDAVDRHNEDEHHYHGHHGHEGFQPGHLGR